MCSIVDGLPKNVLWEDENFMVARHFKEGVGVGYMFLISKRHFQGPSTMNDAEASSVGLVLKRCEKALEKVTGCDRVYTAALGSPAVPHMHFHMVPVFSSGQTASKVTGTPFDVFLQSYPDECPAKAARVAADFKTEMARL